MLNFPLRRDLCFFDVETTGGDVVNDRILQIALVKYPQDGGAPQERSYLINPTIPIKPDASRVHGYTDEMVKNAPPFKLVAVELFDFIGDSDLAGYNSNRFDVPILIEEFARVGLDFSTEGRCLLDAMQIFYKMEPRTLKAALKFYCDKELTDAHDALADTRATAEVFFGQLRRYENVDYVDGDGNRIERPIQPDMQRIHDFVNDQTRVDFTGRFLRNQDGEIIFNFGTHRGEPAHKHPSVLQWILQKDFPLQVKNIAKAILNKKLR